MHLSEEICTIEEVAAALGRDASYVRTNWRRLNARAGFPRPLPGSSYDRWSRFALIAWLQANGEQPADEQAGDLVARSRAAIHDELGVNA